MNTFITQLALLLFCAFQIGYGQETPIKNPKGLAAGAFEIGLRSTGSVFKETNYSFTSIGSGGQFRIRLSDKLNTEWFLDYMSSSYKQALFRKDLHIGWSVMYYILPKEMVKTSIISPYLIAGHCFDFTRFKTITNNQKLSRWSGAVQSGLGAHIFLSPFLNLTLSTQYMIHLGPEIKAEQINQDWQLAKNLKGDFEGHFLQSISLNFYVGKLWAK